MSKIIIVKRCIGCPCSTGILGHNVCKEKAKYCPDKGIPDWCPLSPMPESPKDIFVREGATPYELWHAGWDAAIDAISGGGRRISDEMHETYRFQRCLEVECEDGIWVIDNDGIRFERKDGRVETVITDSAIIIDDPLPDGCLDKIIGEAQRRSKNEQEE